MNEKIFITKPLLPPYDEYTSIISSIWNNHQLTNFGPLHKQFEITLKKYLGVKNIALCCNGHLGLESIFETMNLTGEVITTPFTFSSTTNAIIRCGLTPVMCDIRKDDYTLDPDLIEEQITTKTSAIVPVHIFGNICQTNKIESIAKKHNIPVIYDAAHVFGSRNINDNIYLRGTASVLSFHATKVFNTIEGGAVIVNDTELYEKLNMNHNFGFFEDNNDFITGGNAKMNEFCAAMGLCNLHYLDNEIAKRHLVSEKYKNSLKCSGIKLLSPQKNMESNYSYFPVVFTTTNNPTEEIFETLIKNNYYAKRYFYPLTCDFKTNNRKCVVGKIPNARYISERVLCLPIFGDLEDTHIDNISTIIMQIIKKYL